MDGEEGAPPVGEGSSSRDGWESVAPPRPPEDHGREWEMVAAGRGASAYDDGCFVFPPSDHEGLHVGQSFMAVPEGGLATGVGGSDSVVVPSWPSSSSSSSSSSTSSSSSSSSSSLFVSSSGGFGEVWRPGGREGGSKPFVELARRAVRSWCELYLTLPRPRVGGRFGRVKHGAVWSSAAVAGLAVILLLCVRRRYQREKLRLLLLIQEKDQKISHLLLQIAQMNEALSSRRRVPVLRTA